MATAKNKDNLLTFICDFSPLTPHPNIFYSPPSPQKMKEIKLHSQQNNIYDFYCYQFNGNGNIYEQLFKIQILQHLFYCVCIIFIFNIMFMFSRIHKLTPIPSALWFMSMKHSTNCLQRFPVKIIPMTVIIL